MICPPGVCAITLCGSKIGSSKVCIRVCHKVRYTSMCVARQNNMIVERLIYDIYGEERERIWSTLIFVWFFIEFTHRFCIISYIGAHCLLNSDVYNLAQPFYTYTCIYACVVCACIVCVCVCAGVRACACVCVHVQMWV